MNLFPFIENTIKWDVCVRNVTSLGFSSVEIPAVHDNGNWNYNISLTLSDLKLSGIYSAVGSHHYFYPIVGDGPFDITLLDVSSSGTTTLMLNGKAR